MKKFVLSAFLFACISVNGAEPPRNILWDSCFETGYANNYWGTVLGNQGPNMRSMWSDGVLTLSQTIASRVYILDEGVYTLCAWVKRSPGFENEDQPMRIRLLCTNRNYYRNVGRNEYHKTFEALEGEEWHRVGWSFEIKGPVRNQFHVEISGEPSGAVLLDAVSLTPGSELPEKARPAADVEAGFFIPEETGFYIDGEERVVDLLVRNHGDKRQAKVNWRIFDHYEELVKQGVLAETLPAETTIRRRIPMQDLPYGGYRLACDVEGMPVLGDGLVAILPAMSQDSLIQWGADAPITRHDFIPRYMKRLGMKIANTLSCAGGIGRWRFVNPEEGEYLWSDKAVDKSLEAGLEVIGFLGLKYPPAWVRSKYMEDGKVTDEDGFTKAFCNYVDAFVRHYAGRITTIHIEDEIGGSYGELYPQIHKAAIDTARKAARESGTTVSMSINCTQPGWWADFLNKMPPEYIEFVSQNTNLRPAWTVQTLNILRAKKHELELFYTIGVGQKSVLRPTSLINVRGGSGSPPGLFAWQLMMNAWLSRPYETENLKDGPIIRMGYYDMRTLGQCVYLPAAGKTAIEYDNSPTLGLQGMAMQRHWIADMRPVRDPALDYSLNGEATAHPRLFAYPFRNDLKAVVVLTTVDASDIKTTDFDHGWTLSGMDFKRYKITDLFGATLEPAKNGAVSVHQLPVLFRDIPAESLVDALNEFKNLEAEPVLAPEAQSLTVGDYTLDIDPEREGYIRLITHNNGKETVILDQIIGLPEPLPKPDVEILEGRVQSSANLSFGREFGTLTITLTDQGATLAWSKSNVRKSPVKQTIRFRVSNEGAGRDIVIQEGQTVRAGHLREDYGALTPAKETPEPEPLHPDASKVVISNFAEFYLSGATGAGVFAPQTGFRWKQLGGDAYLEADYKIGPYQGGGSRGVQRILMSITVSLSKRR